MPTFVKNEVEKAKDILSTFAEFGYRKTSMEDIARAAGVSRQSIYKKFGSKKKCYEWTVHCYLSDMYARIFSTLEDDASPALQTLIRVFDILIGEAVVVASRSNGAEILKDVLRATHSAQEDWPLRFRARLADFLKRNRYVPSEKAEGMVLALISAGKGLLLEEETRDQFLEDMTLIIKSVVNQNS